MQILSGTDSHITFVKKLTNKCNNPTKTNVWVARYVNLDQPEKKFCGTISEQTDITKHCSPEE
jgi:hypothetical protein